MTFPDWFVVLAAIFLVVGIAYFIRRL